VLVTKHGVAGNRTVAAKSASPTATDTVTLLNITLFNSTISDAGRIATLCRFAYGSALLRLSAMISQYFFTAAICPMHRAVRLWLVFPVRADVRDMSENRASSGNHQRPG
jgi:hypothetical protein